MCVFDKTINPALSNSSSWRQRRPDLVLVESPTKWSYSGYRDRAYPSPPMSGSPTSPGRSTTHYNDDRFTAGSANAPGIHTNQTPRSSVDGQVAIPAGYQSHHHQQQYGQYRSSYQDQQRYEIQPRPLVTHSALAPHYQPNYSQTQELQGPLPLVPTSRSQVPGMATFQGPTSLGAASNSRIARTTRRAKAHVARACQNCKKAHLSCDEARPCARCVSSGKQATCIDVEHKKRGRPRLRDDRDQRLEQAAAAAVASAMATAQQTQRTSDPAQSDRVHDHQRGDPLRVLRSQAPGSEGLQGQGQMPHLMADPRYQQHYQPGSESYRNSGAPLTAFLNMDLRILKASNELSRLFADGGDIRGRSLSEFIGPQHQQALRRIQSDLRDERTSREPTFLPGIFPEQQEQESVAGMDVEAADSVSQGYSERRDTFSFRMATGQTEHLHVSLRLAKTRTFFATLILQRQQMQPQPQPIPQPHPFGRSGGYLPIPQPSPTQMGFPQHGPPSPYNTNSSAPASPFSTLHTALITTLSPASSHSTSYSYAPSQVRADSGFLSARHPASSAAGMYPPPPPSLSRPPSALSEARPDNARERQRPPPLGNLQLPPIVSSAPTTPMTSDFFHHQQIGPSSETKRQSPPRRSPEHRPSSDDDEEDQRKRRRLDITQIIER